MRLLCIGDLHGHSAALAAVLASAERRGYERLLVAGDLCFPGPDPLGTWRRLVALGATMVRGATDTALFRLDPEALRPTDPEAARRLSRFREVQRELGPLVLDRLRKMPDWVRVPLEDGRELLLVHGSPVDPLEPFTHDMSDEEMSALIGDDPADVIVCGGSHVPFQRMVQGVRVLGVGSVGEAPSPSGLPEHADAVFIETFSAGPEETLRAEHIVVPIAPAGKRRDMDGAA